MADAKEFFIFSGIATGGSQPVSSQSMNRGDPTMHHLPTHPSHGLAQAPEPATRSWRWVVRNRTHARIAVTVTTVTLALVMSAGRATAAQVCWDFADLSQEVQYRIGDTYTAENATIEFKNYLNNGTKVSNPGALAQATNTEISRGTRPELRTYVLNAHVEPNAPLRSVRFRYGLFVGADGIGDANLGVNGEMREVAESYAELDGEVLGKPALGTVEVSVVVDNPLPNPDWETGVVTLTATQGAIEKWTFGGVQLFLDDVCLQK